MTPEQQAALTSIDAARGALDLASGAIAEASRVLRASLAEPGPVDPPPVDPLPPGELHVERVNLTRLVYFAGWHDNGSNYQRQQELTIWRTGPVTVDVTRRNLSNGTEAFRPARRYSLLVDGAEVAAVDAAEGQQSLRFGFACDLTAGWHTLSIGGLADGESCPTWFAVVPGGNPSHMPVCTGSYDLSQHRIGGTHADHAWLFVPVTWGPVPAPLQRGDYHPVTIGDSVRAEWLAPGDQGDVPRANVNRDGVINTFCRQAYYWEDATMQHPRVMLLDGPRAVGTCVMPTHIDIGTGTQGVDDPTPINNVYVLDPWRLCRVTDTGTVTTLIGWRHKPVPSHWEDEPVLDLVGDWSAIPPERRGMWEAWGMAWVASTLEVDTDAAPIPSEGGRQPHRVAPACLVTDTQHNRILRVDFDARAHGVPPVVTEWMTGLNDPWDIVAWGNHYLVSERQAHRIIEVDEHGVELRTVVQGSPGSLVRLQASPRRMQRLGSLADIQAEPCLGPEGLAVMDGWLYWGSYCQGQVRRVHLHTGEVQVVIAGGITDGNSKFVKIAVSDGSFGPRGAVAVQTWSVGIDKSARTLHLPDGKTWRVGAADPWGPTGYGSSVAIGGGRTYTGSSQYGLLRYSAGPAWDRRLYAQGEAEFQALHGLQQWGIRGTHGMPAGLSAALDYFREVGGG